MQSSFVRRFNVVLTGVLGILALTAGAARAADHIDMDRTIALLGTRNGEAVLAFGIWGVVVLAVLQASPLVIANTALVYFTLAELLRCGTRLYYYRRGV